MFVWYKNIEIEYILSQKHTNKKIGTQISRPLFFVWHKCLILMNQRLIWINFEFIRGGMIQTLEQYEFIYQVLAFYCIYYKKYPFLSNSSSTTTGNNNNNNNNNTNNNNNNNNHTSSSRSPSVSVSSPSSTCLQSSTTSSSFSFNTQTIH